MNRNATHIPARPAAELAGRAARYLAARIGRIVASLRGARPGAASYRLGAHLQADIGLRDTRPTRYEATEPARCAGRLPNPDDVIRHRIWTGHLD